MALEDRNLIISLEFNPTKITSGVNEGRHWVVFFQEFPHIKENYSIEDFDTMLTMMKCVPHQGSILVIPTPYMDEFLVKTVKFYSGGFSFDLDAAIVLEYQGSEYPHDFFK